MRKIFKAGLCGLAAVMLITGCSTASSTTESSTTESSTTESAEADTSAGETTKAAETTSEEASKADEEISRGTITLGDYKGVTVEVEKLTVTDEELELSIQNIIMGNPTYVDDAPGPAKEGDIVNIDYEGFRDGKAFDGGTDTGFDLTLGSGQFIEGFEEGLIGVSKGEEKSINLTFPDPYQNPDLAGKDVVFEVTVNSIRSREESVLDDDFVKRVSPDDETVEKFREGVKESILEQKQALSDQKKENDVVNAVAGNATIECNEAAIDEIYNRMINQYTLEASYYGMDLESFIAIAAYGMSDKDFYASLKDSARQTVEQELVLTAVAEKEKFEITDEDRQSLAESYQYPDTQSLIDAVGIEQVDKMAGLHKALAYLVDNAAVTEVEPTEEATEAKE